MSIQIVRAKDETPEEGVYFNLNDVLNTDQLGIIFTDEDDDLYMTGDKDDDCALYWLGPDYIQEIMVEDHHIVAWPLRRAPEDTIYTVKFKQN